MQIVIARGLKVLTCVSVVLQLYLVFALAQGSAPTGSEANEQTGQPAIETRPSAEQLQASSPEKQVPPPPLNPKKEAWKILETAFAGKKQPIAPMQPEFWV